MPTTNAPPTPTWLTTLRTDGVAVIPSAIPQSECDAFADAAYAWLESFGTKFDRHDRRTWTSVNLPPSVTGGMYSGLGVEHEAFVWAVRTQPGILSAFATAWDVSPSDLIASFDGINVTFPLGPHGRGDIKPTKPWPHIDQNPTTAFELYQGIASLSPSGPDDGGLCVLRGSHKLHNEFFTRPPRYVPENQPFFFSDKDVGWYKRRGCEVVKVVAGRGDLIYEF